MIVVGLDMQTLNVRTDTQTRLNAPVRQVLVVKTKTKNIIKFEK
jgi:hypothetical protein